MIRQTLAYAFAALGLAIGSPATIAAPANAADDAIAVRARAAGFNGVILIGEPDGSSRVLPIGPDAVKPDATWRWASVTKQLAAIVTMQEAARGTLDLDAPVSRYWPEWRAPNAAAIRVRDLLTHASGLPQPDATSEDAEHVPAFYRRDAAAPSASAVGFCAGPPRADPPADFNYNNCDFIVLSEVLARVTGKPFEQLLHDRFARPLKLRSLGLFRFGRAAHAHVRPVGEGKETDAFYNLGTFGAAGGAYGTIEDLWKIDQALMQGSLLPEASRAAMWQGDPARGYAALGQWSFPAPLSGCKGAVKIIERRGEIGGIEIRNVLLPEQGRALIAFSRHLPAEFGEIWMGKGLSYDLLSLVACRKEQP